MQQTRGKRRLGFQLLYFIVISYAEATQPFLLVERVDLNTTYTKIK